MLAQVFEFGKTQKMRGLTTSGGLVRITEFDGYRWWWRGKLISRANKVFEGAHEWFLIALHPNNPLDGELWVGRENFQAMGVVRKRNPDRKNGPVKYVVYDLPDEEKPFEERIKLLQKIVKDMNVRWNIIRKKFQNLSILLNVLSFMQSKPKSSHMNKWINSTSPSHKKEKVSC